MPRLPLHLLACAVACLLVVGATGAQPAADSTDSGQRLLLYPDIHRDFVVFVHDEDIWRAPSAGGTARRLTSHDGLEIFPKISPDGRWIAFSAEYSGSRQIWVMPSEGGTPRQLTFYTDVGALPPRGGWDGWVLGWTPDGEILARLNRTPFGERMGRYFRIDPEGGLETPLPLPHGGSASFSADGTALAYTPIDREFRTWKRSFGGRAQDLWIYDLEAERSQRLTGFRGTDNFPMWHGDTIYFLSDRDYTLELFALDAGIARAAADGSGADLEPGAAASEKSVRQVTDFDVWDVLWPSQGPESIVFTAGGDLYRLDLDDETTSRIDVAIHDDRPHAAPRFETVSDNIDSATLSPQGHRIVFDARGELFSVPAEKGPTRNLSKTPAAREHEPAFSPDGRWLAYLSDASGEYEIYLRPTDGSSAPRQLTNDASVWRFAPEWSPDSSTLAFSDRKRRLFVIDVESGEQTLVDRSFRGDFTVYVFSPDSRWLAYERTREDTRMTGISLFSLDSGEVTRFGDGQANDYSPAWSADGTHLIYLSDRDFNLRFSAFEFNYVYDRATRLYATMLDPAADPMVPLESDEVAATKESDDAASAEGASDTPSTETGPTVRLVTDGLEARTIALPGVEPAAYTGVRATADAVYLARFGDGAPSLHRYDLAKHELSQLAPAITDYELSADGSKLLYQSGPNWHLIPSAGNGGKSKPLDLSALRVKLDPRVEWRQIFDDGWRISRDFFYDEAMHGMDWQAIGERYRSLLPRIAHRSELDFLFGEMVGELGAGHTYVQPGESDSVERVEGGMLGAEFEADDEAGVYRIARIYDGENWHDNYRSPLTEPGIVVAEGDYLLAIDGESLSTDDNPYRLLEGKANTQVTLTINDRPSADGAREVIVRPTGSELNLRYIDWVKSRLRLVDELSDGRVGYIHLPNTAIDGNRMLQKMFYAQSNKEALIIDDRYNGGGFIPDRMIEYFDRPRLAYWAMRDIDSMRTPGFTHIGPKAMLMNGYSSSGGDALPYFFRQLGLGKLVGTRTWGGLIGLNGNPAFADGGAVILPTFRIYDDAGEWVVENEGVEPDVEVFDLPEELAQGGDPSIEAAVELLLDELEANPVTLPTRPEPPDLSRAATPRCAASPSDRLQ
ncbi:MAG: PDZ domain-containing protein [Acidobacteriota bacterium]